MRTGIDFRDLMNVIDKGREEITYISRKILHRNKRLSRALDICPKSRGRAFFLCIDETKI
jgi:hypothetical protein